MRASFDIEAVRGALIRLPDVQAQESLAPPPLQTLFVPANHNKALGTDATVVVGMRGAGKSLWTAVLLSERHREFVAGVAASEQLARARVRVGFGLDESNTHFPSAAVFSRLLERGVEAHAIWRWILLRHALGELGGLQSEQSWTGLDVDDWMVMGNWAQANPQRVDQLLARSDALLAAQDKTLLVLFDALDRLSDDWGRVRLLLGSALRIALTCRAFRAIRTKFFLRPDMEEDAGIWDFPDSSKLRHGTVELQWRSADLYALMLTILANDPGAGEGYRQWVRAQARVEWPERAGVHPVPRAVVRDEETLRNRVEEIAGKWMGKSAKRGFTYSWIPTHLADAAGRVSPRSFLLTLKQAAEVTDEQYSNWGTPLHYEAIQQGVARASQIRIAEIAEDYPWVRPLLEAASGLSVPCDPEELVERWTPRQITAVRGVSKLPPRRFTTDPVRAGKHEMLLDDLVELAVLYRTEDGRVNVPDIFRVGFGIRRKGGVKPPR